MPRIVLTTFGSLGDLHPYVAVGLALRERGHDAVIATHAYYRERVEGAGLEFAAVRPDFADFGDFGSVLRQGMDERRGSEYILHRLVLPFVRDTRDDLLVALESADLLVDHALTFTAPLVAEKLGIPRVSTTLQPFAMFSAYDPPTAPAMPMSHLLRGLGPLAWKPLWLMARMWTRRWFREVDAMRREMGLPATNAHPLLDHTSSLLHLVLFSRELAPPAPDWPASSVQCGFPFFDHDATPAPGATAAGLSPALAIWLDAGEPPIVFTLGSAAVHDAQRFYHEAAAAAARLERRAVLLTGPDGINALDEAPDVEHARAGSRIVRAAYAPHSGLFPRGAALVHQGGVGTTAQALRSGRPMVIVPFSHDQPDNAARCVRLGVARTVPRRKADARHLERELRAVLADERMAARADRLGARVRAEHGARAAAAAIERVLAK